MPLVDEGEAFLPVYWTAGADESLNIISWMMTFPITDVHTFFLTTGTTPAVINSAQVLQTKLLELDPHKMKNKQKPQRFCLM